MKMESRKIVAVYCVVLFLLLSGHPAQSRTTPLIKMQNVSEVYPKLYQQIRRSTNQSLPIASIFSPEGSPALSSYYAIYQSNIGKKDNYYGFKATIDIYGHHDLVKDQITSALIWIVNFQDDQNLEAIQVGWHVHPNHYGDTKTHFFVLWTADGYKSWCYNRNCPGFNFSPGPGNSLEPGSVLPTSTLPPSTHQEKHTLAIRIAKENDVWSISAAVDGPPTYIGNFPCPLFKNLKDKATDINFGGFTESPEKTISPPMGSGFLRDSEAAATFKDVQYLDYNGNPYGIDWKLPSGVSDEKCYNLGSLENNQFTYGGPGGCTGGS